MYYKEFHRLKNGLNLTPLSNGNYILTKSYKIRLDNGDLITVPKGYQTNGADIPRLFWRLYPPYSPEYMSAVVIHDYLCDRAIETAKDKKDLQDLFLYADNAFREILEKLNIKQSKVKTFYNAVRFWHKLRY